MNQNRGTRKEILGSARLIRDMIQHVEGKICHTADNPSKEDIDYAALDVESIKDEADEILNKLETLKEK